MKIKTGILTGAILLAAGAASASVIFSQSFNSITNFYDSSSYGTPLFGVNGQIYTNYATMPAKDGVSFAAVNVAAGAAGNLSVMAINLGTVANAGVTYTFSGWFGYVYGTQTDAAKIKLQNVNTGFKVGSTVNAASSAFVFGTTAKETWSEYTFSYTTTAADIGQTILVQLQLQRSNPTTGLVQIAADDWKVTAVPEPASIGLLGFGVPGILLLRRFLNQ